MLLTEKHLITKFHSEWKIVDELCYKSKNLYNYSNYLIRKYFEESGKYLYYNLLEKELKTSSHETYTNLPNNTSQQILLVIDRNFRSFFQSLRSWKKKIKLNLKGVHSLQNINIKSKEEI